MAFNALHSVTNKNELECICRKWHIHRWNRLLYALLIKYLGVPADLLPFSTSLCPDKLMQEIWESGNLDMETNVTVNVPPGNGRTNDTR